jgi:hypothetical protein
LTHPASRGRNLSRRDDPGYRILPVVLREADYLPLSLRLDHGIEVARAFQPVMALMGGRKARK